jgi:hypothetical protein
MNITQAQFGQIARDLSAPILNAQHLGEMPGDEWLNARLRQAGCDESDLPMWRERILETPLRDISD